MSETATPDLTSEPDANPETPVEQPTTPTPGRQLSFLAPESPEVSVKKIASDLEGTDEPLVTVSWPDPSADGAVAADMSDVLGRIEPPKFERGRSARFSSRLSEDALQQAAAPWPEHMEHDWETGRPLTDEMDAEEAVDKEYNHNTLEFDRVRYDSAEDFDTADEETPATQAALPNHEKKVEPQVFRFDDIGQDDFSIDESDLDLPEFDEFDAETTVAPARSFSVSLSWLASPTTIGFGLAPLLLLALLWGTTRLMAAQPVVAETVFGLVASEPRTKPHPGLMVDGVAAERVVLDDGSVVLRLSGDLVNASPHQANDVVLQARLYDSHNSIAQEKLVYAANGIATVSRLGSLTADAIERLEA
ncbi:MAG: hypothetical protein KDD44_07390, partial [Bdellovibrionales bacterium]|nr:hypothetical protein [Bdellovibrionales bacterium]